MTERTNILHIVGYVLLGAILAGGLWALPELRRFRLIHSM